MMAFNRGEIEQNIQTIKELYDYYKSYCGRDNEYTLYLASGEAIKYSFNPNNIAHLLGINFDELVNKSIISGKSTEELLDNLLDDLYNILNKFKDGIVSSKRVFSPYLDQKIDGFKENLKIPYSNEIKFICKYNREINYTGKEIDGITADYIIARENDNNDIVLLLLKQMYDNNNIIMVPQSCRIIRNDEHMIENLSLLLSNQPITYLTGINIKNNMTGYDRNIYPNILQIINLLTNLRDISQLTNAIPSTIDGHIYNVKALKNNKNETFNNRSVNAYIKSKINNDEMIILSENAKSQLTETELLLINHYNDNKADFNEEGRTTYSQLNEEYIRVCENNEATKEELMTIKEQLRQVREENELKDAQISDLKQIETDYYELSNQLDSIHKTLKRRNN